MAFVYAYALWVDNKHDLALIVLMVAIFLILISALFLFVVFSRLQKYTIKLTSAETADQENIAFLLLYVSPLFTGDIDTLNFSIAIPVVILFLIVVMSGNNYHFNPLLNMMGWHFYKVDTPDSVSRVLISRRSIRNVVNDVKVVQLTDYVIMEVK